MMSIVLKHFVSIITRSVLSKDLGSSNQGTIQVMETLNIRSKYKLPTEHGLYERHRKS